ncbi:MAG: hypothetical protein PHX59_00215 [Sulfuricurvum sp.]|nr:hypothetical protein [Sulfuricurvum sp.]
MKKIFLHHYTFFLTFLFLLTACSQHEAQIDLQQPTENRSQPAKPDDVLISEPIADPIIKTVSNLPYKTLQISSARKLTVKSNIAESPELLSERINFLVKTNQTRSVRNLLDKNPDAIRFINIEDKKIFYIGPKDWRVIDLIEGFRNKKLAIKPVITHIKKQKIPYKKFTYDEIQLLAKHKLPLKVINAMMTVSQ